MQKALVLGGGFGGVRVALDLSSQKDLSVTLVNDTPFHCYHPDLYELVTTKLTHEDKLSFENLSSTVNIPLSEIFAGKGVEVNVTKVQSIDLDKRVVKTEGGDLEFDYLVMGLGSDTSYFNIPGADTYSHPLKDTEDALNLHNDLEELLATRDSKLATRDTRYEIRDTRIVIAGGGFTGVEIAGNLAESYKDQMEVVVLEATDHVLGGMPEWAQQKTQERLKDLGVKVILSDPILKVTEKEIELKDTKSLPFDYLIWAAGVKGVKLPGWIKGVQFNPKQQICVQPDLSIKGYPEVFCLGDQSFLEKTPPAAWVALEEAKVIVRNLPLPPQKRQAFRVGPAEFVVSVGASYALSNVKGLRISGFLGYLLKRLVALNYFLSILPLGRSLQLWFKAIRLYPK